ncbi:hypothetical protein LPB86_15750 [Pedobacter sp. MC2016-14]|uniref:hypothetical protein n=1 Tax=Pedobacter sp. MC2016-14 TaxID=2897327 RepID=UPI001E5C6CB4|nr:hypothetical protein [Pedobacter sp. MC2016-14]MCD0489696.1 hypothetical protein [Pedobacter sp. MC2016-14]
MKNFKKVALSLLVVGVALAGSAFTNAKTFLPGDRYVQTSPGTYQLITASYDPDSFCDLTTNPCSFVQQPSDPTNYGSTINLSTITSAPAGSFVASDQGEYTGPLVP